MIKTLGKLLKTILLTAFIACFIASSTPMALSTGVYFSESNVQYDLRGEMIGLSLKTNGLLIMGSSVVLTSGGAIDTVKKSNIKKGDVLLKIENQPICSVEDVNQAISLSGENQSINVSILRGSREIVTSILPARDVQTGQLKLGLWVKDCLSGIGTLTYVSHNKSFGALGHCVSNGFDTRALPVAGGSLYPCEVIGVKKGVSGAPGSILGTFSYYATPLALVENNSDFGLSGRYSAVHPSSEWVEFGGADAAHEGVAYFINDFTGKREKYEISIVKTYKQSAPSIKSMVIRVTDPRLLRLTGGIVQGMSGSPIVQDGRWIGAITHVFNQNPKEGYAVYADWMIKP